MAENTNPSRPKPSLLRRLFRWTFRALLVLAAILVVLLVALFHQALYNRFSLFPRQQAAWETIRSNRMPVAISTGYNEYRGIIHAHSYLSHDSEVPFEHILQTMKDVGRDFIILSDHCQENDNNLYGLQWKGLHDGKLFIQGFEMQEGFLPVGLPEGTVLSCKDDAATLAKKVEEAGGYVFIVHAEQPRQWDLPQIRAMEIYNIHPDFMEELKGKRLYHLITNILINLRSYPDQTIRSVFDPPLKVLDTWDQLSINRDLGGFGGNDSHQNVGIYGIYTQDGGLLVRHAEGKDLKKYTLNPVTRLLLRICFGPLEPGREVFRIQLDPYERMARFVCTHVLAHELTEQEILSAIIAGRAFVGFDMIADSTGFVFMARNKTQKAIMGESIDFIPGETTLQVFSPHVARFKILRYGKVVHEEEGPSIEWQPEQAGKYRVEAYLNILGEWTPWVYTNPVNLREKTS